VVQSSTHQKEMLCAAVTCGVWATLSGHSDQIPSDPLSSFSSRIMRLILTKFRRIYRTALVQW